MRDSQLNEAERVKQPLFIFKLLILLVFLLVFLALLSGDRFERRPDREPSPRHLASLRFERLDLGPWREAGWRLDGAWVARPDDPLIAGLSALVLAGRSDLVALTDSGRLVALPRPGSGDRAMVEDLPNGPGDPHYRRFRDSEALLLHGGERWVTFENRHSLWRYGAGGARWTDLPDLGWSINAGVEAMVMTPEGLLLLPEESGTALLLGPDGRFRTVAVEGRSGGLADATRLPDGRVLVAERVLGWRGIRNRLAWLERTSAGYRPRAFATLPLGPFDNVEGLAAEPLADGRTRLWAITDNDGWRRTVLLALTLDTAKRPGERRAASSDR
jgi:hypothetical protein